MASLPAKLSVVFTTYNSLAFWQLQHPTFEGFEVIVANDGSTAETAELIEHWIQQLLDVGYRSAQDPAALSGAAEACPK